MSNKTINLINKTHLTIAKQNLVSPTQSILITISGGQDSLCLFFILLHLKKQWKWHFGLLYCNHFWQIDSFYTNSLVLKLGFLFLIPAYLSLPSENIFSEQKSRTWRYRQFERLSNFYKYEIIFTGHTSTDRIETVFLQLLRGTGTRGLSTLDWIRPVSRDKSPISRFSPEVTSNEQGNQANLPDPLPCRERQGPRNLVSKICLITEEKGLTKISKITNLAFESSFFPLKEKSYGRNLGRNTVALQGNVQGISYRNINWIYDKFLFLTLEKTTILTPFYKFNYSYFKKSLLLRSLYNTRYLIFDNYKSFFRLTLSTGLSPSKVRNQGNGSRSPFNSLSSYNYNRNLINLSSKQIQQLSQLRINPSPFTLPIFLISLLETNSRTFPTSFSRSSSFIISRRIIFREYFVARQVSTVGGKIKCLFYLTSNDRLESSVKPRFKHSILSKKDTRSSFIFKTVILNKKPSKVLIKYLKISYWIEFRRNFTELEVFKLKNILNFEITPFLIKSYFCLSHYQQAVIIRILDPPLPCRARQGLTTVSFWDEVFGIEMIFDNFASSKQGSGIQAKLVNLTTNEVSSLGKEKKDLTYIEKRNSVLNVNSLHTHEKNKNLALFLNTNQKLELGFSLWSAYNLKKKRHNWGENFFFCQKSMDKENSFKETQNNAKSSNKLNLVARTKEKIVINCPLAVPPLPLPPCRSRQGNGAGQRGIQTKFVNLATNRVSSLGRATDQLSLKNKTKNLLHRNFLLLNKPIYKIKDYTILSSLGSEYDFICKINTNVPLILPNQREFTWHQRNTKKCFVVRPLLFITRFDLKKLCAFWQLPIYPDRTNEKLVYFRNRIRKQLLPLLRFFFNPQIDKLFLQFAEIANTEQLYLEGLSMHLQQEFEIKKTNTFELNLSVFNFIPMAIQRRLLKQFLNQYFTKQIKFFHIQILLNVLAKRKKSPSTLYDKLRDNDNLISRENFEIGYQMLPKVIFSESLNVLPLPKVCASHKSSVVLSEQGCPAGQRSAKEKKNLETPKVPNLTKKIRSEFLKHYIVVKQGTSTKSKLKRNLVNLDKKLKVRNIFSGKNKLETPQILFFAGVGACFITSRRFILLSNFLIV